MEIHLEEVDSTNTWAKQHLSSFPEELVVISTDSQFAGRGRFKRVWVAPPKTNLTLSYCLPLSLLRHPPAKTPLLLALSTLAILEPLGFAPQIKWPNDILLNGKKCAGILTETADGWIIMGIGLNVNMEQAALDQIDRPASSLRSISGRTFALPSLQTALTTHFRQALVSPFPTFQEKLWAKKGDLLSFHNFLTIRSAQFLAMQEDGTLLVEMEGKQHTLLSGEILDA